MLNIGSAVRVRTRWPLILAVAVSSCAPIHGPRGSYMRTQPPDRLPPLNGAGVRAQELWEPHDAIDAANSDGTSKTRRWKYLEDVVRRFAPSVVLANGDHTVHQGNKLRLLPANVALLADTLRIDVMAASPYNLRSVVDVAVAHTTTDSLAAILAQAMTYRTDPDQLVEMYFDVAGRNPREWWAAYAAQRIGPDSARWSKPTVYAHPFIDPDGRLVIQYWYFYPFNDFIGNHEGDWEHVNVVPTADLSAVAQVQYYFHHRSATLPANGLAPEIVDGTHPVIYVGGRMYHLLDYPIRVLAGDRNQGSHAQFPFPGEWDNVAAMGAPESVKGIGSDSSRWLAHDDFDVILLPEPTRLDFRAEPELLREWLWFVLPVRFGFPEVPSLGSELMFDVGNRSPYGPAFHVAWNRNAPGHVYQDYVPRRIGTVRSWIEDLLQPWYYAYVFRKPRYADDTSRARRQELVEAGLAPENGAREKGFGTSLLGASIAQPTAGFAQEHGRSTGLSAIHNLWLKARLGALEFQTGYQRFPRTDERGGSLYIYPVTASVVARMPDALIRPYATLGGGVYGWEARVGTEDERQLLWSGWSVGHTEAVGIEYYLRTYIALDVALRLHATRGPGPADRGVDTRAPLRFWTLYIGHFVRF